MPILLCTPSGRRWCARLLEDNARIKAHDEGVVDILLAEPLRMVMPCSQAPVHKALSAKPLSAKLSAKPVAEPVDGVLEVVANRRFKFKRLPPAAVPEGLFLGISRPDLERYRSGLSCQAGVAGVALAAAIPPPPRPQAPRRRHDRRPRLTAAVGVGPTRGRRRHAAGTRGPNHAGDRRFKAAILELSSGLCWFFS